ncbi:MAG: hypothetical protein ACYC64_18695 [Armatimonadota bacterium]
MRRILLVIVLIMSIPIVSSADSQKHWRLAGSYTIPTFSDTHDLAGSAWGVGFDYSFLGPEDEESMGGDVSLAVGYKRFSKNHTLGSFSLNRVLIGLKWRGGSGATCDKQGLYGGAGIGLALISSVDSESGTNYDNNRATMEWSVFGGANFSNNWFAEVGYNSFGEFLNFDWANIDLRLGLRL